jgi:hypothetical protein
MKKIVRILTILLLSIKFSALWAYDFSAVSNGQMLYYNILSDTIPYTVEIASENDNYPYYTTYPFGTITIPTSVTVNDTSYSVVRIGDFAFYQCRELTQVIIPNTVKTIGQAAFNDCMFLTKVDIPNSVKSIGQNCFGSCSSLTSFVLNDSITKIEDHTFMGCYSMGTFTFGKNVKSIGTGAFQMCYALKKIEIPNSVDSIHKGAFGACILLKTIIIGSSVKFIDMLAFGANENLKQIYIKAGTPPQIHKTSFSGIDTTIPVYVPCGSINLYKADTIWNLFTNIQEGYLDYRITIHVNDDSYGDAMATAPDCYTYQSTLIASPESGYIFDKWNDGDTNNPRTIIVSSDTSFTAIFKDAINITEQYINNHFIIYPNPTNNHITLDNGQELMKAVYLYDVMGRKVQHLPVNAPSTTVDVSNLPNGIYVVKINTASGVLVRKVQVMR